jgi:peptide methionine sulfoxide reductase MsrB
MKGKLNKEKAERILQQKKGRQKVVVKQKEEEEGTKMETKLKNEKKQKIMNFSSGGRILFSQTDKFHC